MEGSRKVDFTVISQEKQLKVDARGTVYEGVGVDFYVSGLGPVLNLY
jgi:hypothetical protein